MSIRGALDVLDDDELAYVMAHELTHGEKTSFCSRGKETGRVGDSCGYIFVRQSFTGCAPSWQYSG